VEWKEYQDGDYLMGGDNRVDTIECIAAVVDGVPNFKDALLDPLWGEAARQDLQLLTNVMHTLVPISSEDGRALVRGCR
jgi:hypothetical protein